MTTMSRSEVRHTAENLAKHFADLTFTTAQAAVAGVPSHRIHSAVRAGLVMRLWRGHYRVTPDTQQPATGQPIPIGQTCHRPAIPGLTPLETERIRATISHLSGLPLALGLASAAAAWHLPTGEVARPPSPILLAPPGLGIKTGCHRGVHLLSRTVDAHHIVIGPGGVPMTDPLLTAIHIASPPTHGLAGRLLVLHGGMRRQLEFDVARASDQHNEAGRAAEVRMTARDLARRTADVDTRTRILRGAISVAASADIRSLDRVITTLQVADPRIETALESLSWAAFIMAGIPMPTPQALIRGAQGSMWRVDFLFGGRVVGECDGAVKYHAGHSLWAEKQRQMDIEAAGYIVVRWTWEEILHRPHVVLQRIASALSRRSAIAP